MSIFRAGQCISIWAGKPGIESYSWVVNIRLPRVSIRFGWVGTLHVPHAVAVAAKKGRVNLTGDLAFFYGNLEENIPVASFFDLVECYEGMDHVRKLPGIVVPSHDPETLKRHPEESHCVTAGYVGGFPMQRHYW